MKNKHEWRDKAEDGEQVYYRVIIHAGRWEFYFTRKSDPDWQACEVFPLEQMNKFREILWNKHLRRRVPLKHVEQVDAMIEDLEEREADSSVSDPE